MVICVVGLGYVGLPLAVAFGRLEHVIGFDIKSQRIDELRGGHDSTGEVSGKSLREANVDFTTDPAKISKADVIIVAVPTPVDPNHIPDLTPLVSASETVGRNLKRGAIVVYESTVYPGVTEEVCLPILEKESGMRLGDFTMGYSPERINPGDREHTIGTVVKIVSGSDAATAQRIAGVYKRIVPAGIHVAPTIKTAEAAKVIENTQRDLNIALMNELSMIFSRMGIQTKDVLEAAGTKWNFHRYTPGLVGGHCIGVDPYYLTYKSRELGHIPNLILAARLVNDSMALYVTERIVNRLNDLEKVPKRCSALILGLTFKENITDTRNSKVKEIIRRLKEKGLAVYAYDPMLTPEQFAQFKAEKYDLEGKMHFDIVVLATAHSAFKDLSLERLKGMMNDKPYIFDIRNFFSKKEAESLGIFYESL